MLNVKNNYLYDDELPFFWLGDTAWKLYEMLQEDEIEVYIKNRAMLGYNVLQTVLFCSLPKEGKTISGLSIFSEEYFSLVDKVFSLAANYGIYIALLPCWGSYVKNNILKLEDVDKFTDFLIKRFGHNDNLIWVIGGDIKGSENPILFNALGNALKKKDKKHLISFHPFGRTLSATWFNNENWCDFNMFQSGHRRYDQVRLNKLEEINQKYYGEDNWRYVEENFSFEKVKPCLDAEPSYEGVVQGLHNIHEPYWEASDVRRYAYWSLFAGACGFTYGNNAIIQFYTKASQNGIYGVRETWQEALHAEGGMELQYLKKLFEEINYTTCKSRNDLLLSPQKERYHRISIFANDSFLLAYTYCGDVFEISLKEYQNKKVEAFWFNPQNGVKSYIGDYSKKDTAIFLPTKRRELSNDWVLIIEVK